MWKKMNVIDYIVSFDRAVKLYELGMDEPTMCAYHHRGRALYLCNLNEEGEFYRPDEDIPAPFKSQVLKWFRDNYDVDFYITRNLPFVSSKDVYHIVLNDKWAPNDSYKKYKDAEDRLIDNLIELIKQQK